MPSRRNSGFEVSRGDEPSDPRRDFPIKQTVKDFSGRDRHFEIRSYELDIGYGVEAIEKGKEHGYRFSAFDAVSPYLALGKLREKMHRALATRYLEEGELGCHPTHDCLEGRITADSGEMIVVIDGMPVSVEDFVRMMLIYEGWEFHLKFLDRSE